MLGVVVARTNNIATTVICRKWFSTINVLSHIKQLQKVNRARNWFSTHKICSLWHHAKLLNYQDLQQWQPTSIYHGLYASTSCCISQWPSQWEGTHFDTHISEIPRPILMKSEIYKHRRWPPTMPKESSIGRHGWSGRIPVFHCRVSLSFFSGF